MRQRITYSLSETGDVVRSYGAVPKGNRLLDFALKPFDEQMRRAHYDLETAQKYDSRKTDFTARQIREAWA